MTDQTGQTCVAQIRRHAFEGGGFSARPGGDFRPDATAWAILALVSAGLVDDPLVAAGRKALAGQQMDDGRVPNIRALAEAYWPTGLALLAWRGDQSSAAAAARAVDFLVKTKSMAVPYTKEPGADHDTTLVGWPWVVNTYAWLVPTAYAVMGLKAHGKSTETRVVEACRLMLDRQIPSGGWNYGDTFEFDTELLPFPDTTGIALAALAGLCEAAQVEKSLQYLEGCIAPIRAPFSLAWGLLGLTAWGRRPAQAEAWLAESLERQEVNGGYDTEQLALLCLAGQGILKN